MRATVGFVFLFIVLGCSGEGNEGEPCIAGPGLLSGFHCNGELVCYRAGGDRVCERRYVHKLGEKCDSDLNCEPQLYCPSGTNQVCTMRHKEGQECFSGTECEANLVCAKESSGLFCRRPGSEGAPCKEGNVCDGGLTCDAQLVCRQP